MKLRKTFLILLITIFSIFGIFSLTSCFSSCAYFSELHFTLNEDGQSYSLSAVPRSLKTVIIPEEYEGLPVTGIADGVFKFRGFMAPTTGYDLDELHIPSTVTNISINAFVDEDDRNCKPGDIEKLYYGGSLEQWLNISFGSSPLTDCTELYIDGELLEDLTVPESITQLGNNSFKNYGKLRTATLHDNVTSIGEKAFYNCANLSKVDARCVENIGAYAFYNCIKLNEINLINTTITVIPAMSFFKCRSLYSITVPQTVSQIAWNAFQQCFNLVEVYNLSGVELPLGVESVHTSLEEKSIVSYSDGFVFFTQNGNFLLDYTGDETTITLPSDFNGGQYEINSYAFFENDFLTEVIIPNNAVTVIGENAFNYCKNLKSLTLNEGLTEIKYNAFNDCKALKTVNFTGTTEQWNNVIGKSIIDKYCDITCKDGIILKTEK